MGTLIRLSRVWYGEGYVPKFSGDLISDLKHAHELLGGDYQWLYLGPALPGGWLPSFLYVSPLALSTRICGSPSAFTLAVVLLNVVGLLACYYSIRLLYPEHPAVAMVSMLMQAVFPYPVNWSINHLHTNLIIPFSCFAFYGLCLWVREQRAIGVAIAGISISLLLQFHLVGIFLLPLLPLLYVLYRPPINRRVVAAALLPFVLFYGGYLIFDGFNHFKNTLGLIEATAVQIS